MATYNGAQYVVKQINSILCQLSDNDEIVISDDGSTDNTCELLYAIEDERIKVVLNSSPSKGPMANFENALKYAKGDYIFLSDQDDVWASDKVKAMGEKLAQYDLVVSDCVVVDESSSVLISSFFSYRHSKPGFLRNLYKNSYIGCCMAFKREVLNYALPFPSSVHMHDWWIGLLVELKGTVYFLDQPLMNYVRHGNNASPTGELSSYSSGEQAKTRLLLLWNLLKRCLY